MGVAPREVENAAERLRTLGYGVVIDQPFGKDSWRIDCWVNGVEHKFWFTREGRLMGAWDPKPYLYDTVASTQRKTLGDVIARKLFS